MVIPAEFIIGCAGDDADKFLPEGFRHEVA